MAVFLPTSAMGLAVQVVLAILTITFLPPIYNLLRVLLTPASWASRTIPGPPYGHFLSGQMKELRKHAPFELQERWVKQYGKVMRYAVMPGVRDHLRVVSHSCRGYRLAVRSHRLTESMCMMHTQSVMFLHVPLTLFGLSRATLL